MIGAVLFAGPALAEETAVPENNGSQYRACFRRVSIQLNEADKHEGEQARKQARKQKEQRQHLKLLRQQSNEAATTETAEAASAAKTRGKASEVVAETPSAGEAKPKSDKETEAKPEATSQGDESTAAEANKTEKKSSQMSLKIQKNIKTKGIKFNSWEELFKMGTRCS